MKLKIKIILILVGIVLASNANASALKVTPSSLNFDAVSGKPEQKAITIENPDSNVALFEVYLDNFSDWVKINPGSFILEAGKSQEVNFEIENEESGVFFTTISVLAKPLSEREFKTNAGVKIPLEIRISEKGTSPWTASILENFKKFFKNQQSLIYIFAVISILILSGLLTRKNKKVEL